MNDLLTSIGAQITAMLKGVNQVIVRIPDPGDLSALDTLIAQIKSNPIVRYVLKGNMASTEALPPRCGRRHRSRPLVCIDHHLDVRAHAAWNVREPHGSKLPILPTWSSLINLVMGAQQTLRRQGLVIGLRLREAQQPRLPRPGHPCRNLPCR